MIYFNTDVILHSIIINDEAKHDKANELILNAIQDEKLVLSTLSLSNLISSLAKLDADKELIAKSVNLYRKFIGITPDEVDVMSAYRLCQHIFSEDMIEDVLHLMLAERKCERFVTFNNSLEKIQIYVNIKIDVLE
jgi:predicted nucleic acid-binding protein